MKKVNLTRYLRNFSFIRKITKHLPTMAAGFLICMSLFTSCENFMDSTELKKKIAEEIAAANSGEDFSIVSATPEYSYSGVYRDSAIEIQFSSPVAKNTFSYEILIDGSEVSKIHYLEPFFSSNNKIVRIPANSDNLIDLDGKSSKAVTVKIDGKIKSEKGSFLRNSSLEWTFMVNKNTDDIPPVFASLALKSTRGTSNFTEEPFFDSEKNVAWKEEDFYTNHANKIHFSGIAFDGGSGLDYITITETRLRNTNDDAVNDEPLQPVHVPLSSDTEGNAVLDFDYQFETVNGEYRDGLVKLDIALTDKCGNINESKTFYAIKDTFFVCNTISLSNISPDLFDTWTEEFDEYTKYFDHKMHNAPVDFYKNFYWEYTERDVWYKVHIDNAEYKKFKDAGGKELLYSAPANYTYTFEYATDFSDESTIDKYEVAEIITDEENGIKKCTVSGVDFKTDETSYVRITATDEAGVSASVIRKIPGKSKVISYTTENETASDGSTVERIVSYGLFYSQFAEASAFSEIKSMTFYTSDNNTKLTEAGYWIDPSKNTLNIGNHTFYMGDTMAVTLLYSQTGKSPSVDTKEQIEDCIAGPVVLYKFEESELLDEVNKPVFNSLTYGLDAASEGTYYATIDFEPNNTMEDISYYALVYSGTEYSNSKNNTPVSIQSYIQISQEDVNKKTVTIHLPYNGYFVTEGSVSYFVKIAAAYSGKFFESDDWGSFKCDLGDSSLPRYQHNNPNRTITCSEDISYVKFFDGIYVNGYFIDKHKIQYFWTPSYSENKGRVDIYTEDEVKNSFQNRLYRTSGDQYIDIPVCGLKDGNYICYAQVSNDENNPLAEDVPNNFFTLGIMHVGTIKNKPSVYKSGSYIYYTIDEPLEHEKNYLYVKDIESDANIAYVELTALSGKKILTKNADFCKAYIYSYDICENSVNGFNGEYYPGNYYNMPMNESYSAPVYAYIGEQSDSYTLSNLVDNKGRISIITNMPCFVHTLCSYYDYGSDRDEWERRGQETQMMVADSSRNYIIDTSDESGINKGDYYTVFAYYADGTVLQSNVYKKQE